MTVQLILTVMADDQPGIVQKIAEVIASHQAHWQDSSMSRMAGKFAGIIRAECEHPELEHLLGGLQALSASGIRITADTSESGAEQDSGSQVELQVTVNNRSGIIREISAAIAARGANLQNLVSGVKSAPMSAGELFTASILTQLPAGMSAEDIADTLEDLSDDLMVDIKKRSET